MGRQLQVGLTPFDENGEPLRGPANITPTFDLDKAVMVHKMMDEVHCREAEVTYGVPIQRASTELLIARAEAKDKDPREKDPEDSKANAAYMYDSVEEQCEKRKMDPKLVYARERRVLELREMRKSGMDTRGLDGGTDTALVGVDYAHEWYRIMRMSGKIIPRLSKQLDIRDGYATLTAPIVGDAQFLKIGALTTNLFSVNTAVNPTSTTQTWAPQKSQAVIFVSGELTEDSLVPIIDNIKMSLTRGAALAQDHQLISGDTLTSTANINSYANAAQNTGLGSQDPRLSFDGFRAMDYKGTVGKSAFTFSGANCSGIATLDSIASTRQAMGKYGEDPSKCLLIAPIRVLTQVIRDAKARPDTYNINIAGNNGLVAYLQGMQPIWVGNSSIDNTSDNGTGTIPTYSTWTDDGWPTNLAATGLYNGSGNTYTSYCTLREDNILVAWKRQWVIKVVDLPLGDQVAITASYRWIPKQIFTGYGVSCAYGVSNA